MRERDDIDDEDGAIELLLLRGIMDLEIRRMPPGTSWDACDTFREAGVLSGDKGLVLTLSNGHQYQITITRSR